MWSFQLGGFQVHPHCRGAGYATVYEAITVAVSAYTAARQKGREVLARQNTFLLPAHTCKEFVPASEYWKQNVTGVNRQLIPFPTNLRTIGMKASNTSGGASAFYSPAMRISHDIYLAEAYGSQSRSGQSIRVICVEVNTQTHKILDF